MGTVSGRLYSIKPGPESQSVFYIGMGRSSQLFLDQNQCEYWTLGRSIIDDFNKYLS